MVFYFTGTGNSLYAAKQLDEQYLSIPQVIKDSSLEFTADSIGIICPIYGHELPAMVKDFIRRAKFHTDYLYLVLTYGARHGNAVELAQKLFEHTQKQPDYIATLLMVDNFLPVFDMDEQVKLDKGLEQRLAQIKSDIGNRVRSIEKVTLQDRAIHKMFLNYVKNAPENLWTDFKVTDRCIGCGICTRVCPVGCIKLENQQARHTWENCQACYACIHACPQLAISFNSPEKNPNARYRNEHISLCELVAANNQTGE